MSLGFCAPDTQSVFESTGSCLALSYLRLITRLWNDHHRPPHVPPIKVSLPKDQLLHALRRHTHLPDHKFSRLSTLPASARQKIEASFRPARPASWTLNSHEWLTTPDIERVMQQYQTRYPTFKFIGVFPIDFAARRIDSGRCIEERMCRIDLKQLAQQGIRRIAAVFNLDRHNQKGSHWVAWYANFDPRRKNFGAFYYDSVAARPPPEVERLMSNMSAQIGGLYSMKIARRFRIDHNVVKRQSGRSECGLFSMHFIHKMVDGKQDFKDICNETGTDREMHAYRSIFYRPS